MNSGGYLITLLILTLLAQNLMAQNKASQQKEMIEFKKLSALQWKNTFSDSCTKDWKKQWTLDGEKAIITQDDQGMEFKAGPKAFNDADHAVLWTKKEFKGDLKIEYEFTRTDKEIKMVNIIYIQATGSGLKGYEKDISKWASKRKVPKMKTYFNNMNVYHISYAAFGTKNNNPDKDYIRARRYIAKGLRGTEFFQTYENTSLFANDVVHRITIIKRSKEIYMHIKNDQKEMLCHFVNKKFDPISEGRIGLRHMYTRSSRYKNFRISQLPDNRNDAKAQKKMYEIKDLTDFKFRLKKAMPGDTLILPAGNLKNWAVHINRKGLKSRPIIIKGAGRSQTIFSGNSKVSLNRSAFVELKDIGFSDNKNAVVTFADSKYCVLRNCYFSNNSGKEVVLIKGKGEKNQIDNCLFNKNPSVNIRIIVKKNKNPLSVIIHRNLFKDVPPLNGNGREVIQIGQSQTLYGHIKIKALVEKNHFIRCNGEAEIISNKSSSNIYRGNLFKDCKGQLVLRGGGGCIVEGNRFEHCHGGIRISGKRHIIKNNLIWNSQSTGINLFYGVAEKPPAFYQAVSECIIENNTIVNAKLAGIYIGAGRGKNIAKDPAHNKKFKKNPTRYGTKFVMNIAPHDNTIRLNLIYSKDADMLVHDFSLDNDCSNNLIYSLKKSKNKNEILDKNHFQRFIFHNIIKGDFKLSNIHQQFINTGAHGDVCKPVVTKAQ